MFPIKLVSDADIQCFAERMFKIAAENPVCDKACGKYSKTIPEALARSAITAPEIRKKGFASALLLEGALISCTFTLDAWEIPNKWHLSLGLVTPFGIPGRVPDELVKRIVAGFGEGFEELPQEQAFSNVRHFFKAKKD